MHAGWLTVAVLAELASMMAFARLNRFVLRASGVPVRLRDAAATVFAGNALSVTLPGGALASVAYTTRRLRSLGASASLTAFSLAVTGLLSAVTLGVLGATGLLLRGDSAVSSIVGVLALVVAGSALFWLARHPGPGSPARRRPPRPARTHLAPRGERAARRRHRPRRTRHGPAAPPRLGPRVPFRARRTGPPTWCACSPRAAPPASTRTW